MNASPIDGDHRVALRVGSRLHDTDVQTLRRTDYFRHTFEGLTATPPLVDGRYTLDLPNCDGDVFAKTLNTVRTGVLSPPKEWQHTCDAAEYARQLDLLNPYALTDSVPVGDREENTPAVPKNYTAKMALFGHRGPVLSAHWHAQQWHTYSRDGELHIWDLSTLRSKAHCIEKASSASLGQSKVATFCSETGAVKYWSLETNQATAVTQETKDSPVALLLRDPLLYIASRKNVTRIDLRCKGQQVIWQCHNELDWKPCLAVIDERLYVQNRRELEIVDVRKEAALIGGVSIAYRLWDDYHASEVKQILEFNRRSILCRLGVSSSAPWYQDNCADYVIDLNFNKFTEEQNFPFHQELPFNKELLLYSTGSQLMTASKQTVNLWDLS